MDLWTWIPITVLLGVGVMVFSYAFLIACERI